MAKVPRCLGKLTLNGCVRQMEGLAGSQSTVLSVFVMTFCEPEVTSELQASPLFPKQCPAFIDGTIENSIYTYVYAEAYGGDHSFGFKVNNKQIHSGAMYTDGLQRTILFIILH